MKVDCGSVAVEVAVLAILELEPVGVGGAEPHQRRRVEAEVAVELDLAHTSAVEVVDASVPLAPQPREVMRGIRGRRRRGELGHVVGEALEDGEAGAQVDGVVVVSVVVVVVVAGCVLCMVCVCVCYGCVVGVARLRLGVIGGQPHP